MPNPARAQATRNERSVVANAQDDIRRAANYTRLSEKEHQRNENALRHLAEFDARFSRGHWDQDKLDQAVDDLKNIVENNPVSAEDRDILRNDLERLRDFRARHGN